MHYEAIFKPSNRDDYASEAIGFVGEKIAVQGGWKIEHGPHKGEHGYYMPNSTVGIIPQSDLQDLKSLPFARWKDLHSRILLKNAA